MSQRQQNNNEMDWEDIARYNIHNPTTIIMTDLENELDNVDIAFERVFFDPQSRITIHQVDNAKRDNKGARASMLIQEIQRTSGKMYIDCAQAVILWLVRHLSRMIDQRQEEELEEGGEIQLDDIVCLEKDLIDGLQYYFGTFYETFLGGRKKAKDFIYRGKYKSRGMKNLRTINKENDWFLRLTVKCKDSIKRINDAQGEQHLISIHEKWWVYGRIKNSGNAILNNQQQLTSNSDNSEENLKSQINQQQRPRTIPNIVWYYVWKENPEYPQMLRETKKELYENEMEKIRQAYPDDRFNQYF